MAPRIWAESTLDCWAGAAVKKQKRLQNKKSFMRIAILLLNRAVYLAGLRSLENGPCNAGRLMHTFSGARRIHGRSATIEFDDDLAQPAQFRTKLFDHEFDHPNGFMKAM